MGGCSGDRVRCAKIDVEKKGHSNESRDNAEGWMDSEGRRGS